MASTRKRVLFIPGITGYGKDNGELVNIVNSINKLSPNQNRTIVVWHHPQQTAAYSEANWPKDIPALARLIVSDFLKGATESEISVYGYSFGGVLVPEVAKQLKEKGKHVTAGIIDTPHFDFLKKDLCADNIHATERLIRIIKYAATIAGCDPNSKKFTSKEVREISKLPIDKQLRTICSQVVNEQMNTAELGCIISLLAIEKTIANYLALLSTYEMDHSLKLDKLLVMTTEETRDYYQCDIDGGWKNVANKIVAKKLEGTHTSILEASIGKTKDTETSDDDLDESPADKVASCIIESMKKALSSTANSQIRLKTPGRKTKRSLSPSTSSSESSDEETQKMVMGSPEEKMSAASLLAYNFYPTRSNARSHRNRFSASSGDNSSDSDDVDMTYHR